MSSGSSEVSRAGGAATDVDGRGIEADAVEQYLADLASAAPAPGGGSAAALAAALGAALVAMTCRVTAKHAGAAPAGRPHDEIAEEADGQRHRLTTLANDDARAYSGVIAARRLPAPSRDAAMQDALKRATEVPERLAGESRNVLALCERIAPSARASTLSDLGVAAILAHGALRAGALTARTNLSGIADGDFAGETTRRLDALVAEGTMLAERIQTALVARGARTA
jgi:formiminotetrahydrofolate cyclodeaminase